MFLGPSGLGIVSQFITFIGLITSTIHVGTPFSLSTILPALYKKNDPESKQKLFSYFKFFIGLFVIVTLLISIIVIIFSSNIAYILLDNTEHKIILSIIAISIPFIVLYSIFESFLRSSGQINKMVSVIIISNLIAIPILFFLITYLNITGVAFYILLAGLLPFSMMLILYRKVFTPDFRQFPVKLNNVEIKNVFKTGITSLLAFLFYQSVILYLRKFIITNFGYEANGLYQSTLGISLNLFAFMYSFLGNHTLPQLSMQVNDGPIIMILDETAKYIIILVLPVIVILYSFREFIIMMFYSEAFIGASNLMLFQLLGDFFRIFASLFSLWLFSRMKLKPLIIIDLIFNLLLLSFPHIFIIVIQNDLRIVPLSYMLASSVQLLLFYTYTKKILIFKFSKKTKSILYLSVGILIFSVILSSYSLVISYIATFFLLSFWTFIIVKYIEKISIKKIFSDISNRFIKKL
jgi:O-antigen/teichoic acid export membrane protein